MQKLYKRILLSLISALIVIISGSITTFAGTTYTSVSSAATALRNAMLQKKTSTTIRLKLKGTYDFDVIGKQLTKTRGEIFDEAVAYTGTGNTGDYIYWQLSSISQAVSLVDLDDHSYIADYTYTLSYRETAAQESAVKKEVNTAIASMKLSGKSTVDKLDAICNYMKKIKYADNVSNSTLSAYGAAIKKNAVCQGYTLLFYRICNQAGIKCRIVSGIATGADGNLPHAWNIVCVNGKWYHIDSTYDAIILQSRQKKKYFLLGSNAIKRDHIIDQKYTTGAFQKECPISSTSYVVAPEYQLTVVSGSGSGAYRKGTIITVKHGANPAGMKFRRWATSGSISYVSGSATSPTVKIKINSDAILIPEYDYTPVTTLSGSKKIISGSSNYLAIKGSSKVSNTPTFFVTSPAKSSLFRLVKNGKYYLIQNVNSKKYLGLSGKKIVQVSSLAYARKFLIVRSKVSGKYRILFGKEAVTKSGRSLVLKPDTDAAAQRFALS